MRARTPPRAAGLSWLYCRLPSCRHRSTPSAPGAFRGSTEDPAIKYSTAPLNNLVADVNRKLQDGALQLTFEGRSGFLRSALDALQIPVDSQLLVFSRASLQGQTDRRPESTRHLLQRSRRTRLGARRRHHRGRRARRVGWRRVLHARPARGRRRTLLSSSARSSASGVTWLAIRSACPAS